MHQRRNVTEHPLQSHVARIGRGFDLAADVEVAHAVAHLGDCDRSVHPFAHIKYLAGRFRKLPVTSVSNQLPWSLSEHIGLRSPLIPP